MLSEDGWPFLWIEYLGFFIETACLSCASSMDGPRPRQGLCWRGGSSLIAIKPFAIAILKPFVLDTRVVEKQQGDDFPTPEVKRAKHALFRPLYAL
jgi:hypothetical protein